MLPKTTAADERPHRRTSVHSVLVGFLAVLTMFPLSAASESIEQQLSGVFVGRSFTIRNFYRGSHLRYGSDGDLLGVKEPGFWSRDGMVKIFSVKLSNEAGIVFQGERFCVLFDPSTGEFLNVKTGDKVDLSVQLLPGERSFEGAVAVLYKVFLTGKDRLPDLVPSYWRDCLTQKVEHPDKHSAWECVPTDRQQVPSFSGKKIIWDNPLPDTSLHNGTILYTIRHKVGYLAEDGRTSPTVKIAPDPIFRWEQRRTVLDATILVLAFTVAEDGTVQKVSIVSPVVPATKMPADEPPPVTSIVPKLRNSCTPLMT